MSLRMMSPISLISAGAAPLRVRSWAQVVTLVRPFLSSFDSWRPSRRSSLCPSAPPPASIQSVGSESLATTTGPARRCVA